MPVPYVDQRLRLGVVIIVHHRIQDKVCFGGDIFMIDGNSTITVLADVKMNILGCSTLLFLILTDQDDISRI